MKKSALSILAIAGLFLSTSAFAAPAAVKTVNMNVTGGAASAAVGVSTTGKNAGVGALTVNNGAFGGDSVLAAKAKNGTFNSTGGAAGAGVTVTSTGKKGAIKPTKITNESQGGSGAGFVF